MRVIAGMYRNRNLKTPEGFDLTRPTMDRVKEALFNILGFRVHSAKVLDLFAGSGALGIEALSRGAAFVVFNDQHPRALACIKDNLKQLQVPSELFRIETYDYHMTLEKLSKEDAFSIVILDPPYRALILDEIMEIIITRQLLLPDAIVVLECPVKTDVHEFTGFKNKEYHYGNKKLVFLQRLNQE